MWLKRETWNCVQLGLGMCLVFFAFSSQGFIVETVLENRSKVDPRISKNAGYYSQTIIYGAFVISTIISPPVVKFLTPKWSLVFGSSAYTVYMIGFEFLNPYYLYISAAYEGLCAGALWTAMGHYLALNSTSQTIGRNSGMVWLIYSSSFLFGGVFLLIMFGGSPDTSISMATTRELYGTFAAVSFTGNVVFALLPSGSDKKVGSESEATKTKKEAIEEEDKNHKSEKMKEMEMEGNSQQVKSVPAAEGSYMDELIKSWYLLWTWDLLLLIPIFGFSGMELSFWSGVYPSSLSFTKQFKMNTNQLMALSSITVGVGELTGGSLFGLLGARTNRYGRFPIVILGSVLGLISYSLTFINLPGQASYEETCNTAYIQPSIAIALVVGVMLGLTDACVNTQIYSLLSVRYEGRTTQAFALHKTFHAIMSTICMFYGSVLQLQWQLLLLSIAAILSAITFTIVEVRFMKRQKAISQQVAITDTYSLSEGDTKM